MVSPAYINQFFRLRSASDMMSLGLFPNGKEVTESLGALNALHRWPLIKGCSCINAVVVGDGHTPRTAALLAFMSRWTCWSIDPLLQESSKYRSVERLNLFKGGVEDFELTTDGTAVIVAVHSHAPIYAAINAVKARRIHLLAIPCCVNQDIPKAPDFVYEDEHIWSPNRTVKGWTLGDRTQTIICKC